MLVHTVWKPSISIVYTVCIFNINKILAIQTNNKLVLVKYPPHLNCRYIYMK